MLRKGGVEAWNRWGLDNNLRRNVFAIVWLEKVDGTYFMERSVKLILVFYDMLRFPFNFSIKFTVLFVNTFYYTARILKQPGLLR